MGLIQAVAGAIGGAISDQWLDAIVATDMGEGIVFVRGHQARRHNAVGTLLPMVPRLLSMTTRPC